MGKTVCPVCNCANMTQTGNPEIFRCPACAAKAKKEDKWKGKFRLVRVEEVS